MSLHDNGFGRHYATCDTPFCDSNVIDLPPDLEACARILRTFFRWTQLATVVPGETALHECPLCRAPEIKKYRPGGLPRGFRHAYTKETTT